MKNITINLFKTISAILLFPIVIIYLLVGGFLEIGSELFDDIVTIYKKQSDKW